MNSRQRRKLEAKEHNEALAKRKELEAERLTTPPVRKKRVSKTLAIVTALSGMGSL